eukprot:CAMPEP_0198264232 /NCGR_PEP_ID=MMETSP1447-20131203/14963_1 /TAXON_ID=420782 /ORGANISM="Chaetoceros dichaeta, Strain CCMP1751" /LENGTH=33 /DNA_ID= /DNA_START= /DNA_END= /DNA_ORIENTATION=
MKQAHHLSRLLRSLKDASYKVFQKKMKETSQWV